MSNANKSVQGSERERETETGCGGGGGGVRGREYWDSDSERLVTESRKISVFIQPGYKAKVKCFSFLHVSVRKCGSWWLTVLVRCLTGYTY